MEASCVGTPDPLASVAQCPAKQASPRVSVGTPLERAKGAARIGSEATTDRSDPKRTYVGHVGPPPAAGALSVATGASVNAAKPSPLTAKSGGPLPAKTSVARSFPSPPSPP